MSADIAITVGLGIIAYIFVYFSTNTEDKMLAFISMITAIFLILFNVAIMADGAVNAGVKDMLYTALTWIIWFLVIVIFYSVIDIIIKTMDWLLNAWKK